MKSVLVWNQTAPWFFREAVQIWVLSADMTEQK